MSGEGGTPLSELEAAVCRFQARDLDSTDDPKRMRTLIDALELEFCAMVRRVQKRGDHLVNGNITAGSWISQTCGMSVPSAADRVCVGEQLESLPKVAEALSRGEIGYQSASVICHLRDKLGEKRDALDEEQWIGFAREYSVKNLNWLAAHTRYGLDPDGFERDTEENYEARFLHISEMNGMYHLSGVIDPEAGAALKSAVDALAKRLGQDDGRTPKQRRADALTEIVYHAMDEGKLPRRNGVRPHVTVTTTLEGLKGELGAAASELEPGLPISSKTVQRLACDGHLVSSPESGFDGGRCRPSDPRRLTSAAPGAQGPPSRLLRAGLRPAHQLDDPSSHRVLGSRRAEQPAQPPTPLLLSPSPGPRGRLAGDQNGARVSILAAGAVSDETNARTRDPVGGLSVLMQTAADRV